MIFWLESFVLSHQELAPFIIFFLLLLAGINFPISIDIVVILSAFLVTTTLKNQAIAIYISLLLGTYFSAWISYWLGRLARRKLLRFEFIRKFFSQEKLSSLQQFYERNGMLTLLVGRFIPFGIRNCLFLSTGFSKASFRKFILRDSLSCFIWVSVCYYSFLHVSKNIGQLLYSIKKFQLGLFLGFSVTVIGVLCYNLRKNRKTRNPYS